MPEATRTKRARPAPVAPNGRVVVAVPKGRVLEQLVPRLEAAGFDTDALTRSTRQLIREDAEHGVSWLLLKPDDVPTYVEYGAADLGVVGRDVLLEREYDLYAPLDLGIGRCRLSVAGPTGAAYPPTPGTVLRVATKFPHVATRHFQAKGQLVETIFVQGSVELAPLTGLADVIVDLVETGETLRQNGLDVYEDICEVSSVVVANRVGLKLKRAQIAPLLDALGRS
ncbi:MAG: ATP phosphoribosyltransferase [Myxococcales bacterium]|nr:ATP phosphoribosyltransferase [Myxococcales bacterium]